MMNGVGHLSAFDLTLHIYILFLVHIIFACVALCTYDRKFPPRPLPPPISLLLQLIIVHSSNKEV